jgi:alkanesulfonate monooxygenase SsuD/methylene tetrahydromethanopterin reductase-like flavin-dependent oxidoreductase (luciferase family)
LRVGYLIDTHAAYRGEEPPAPAHFARTMDAMIAEGVAAAESGFHSVQVPDRHGRAECHFPGPEQLLTVLSRETERVGLGSFSFVATLGHPMKSAEQFAVIDNLSGGRLTTTIGRGFYEPFWKQFGIPLEHRLGRFQEAIKVWRKAFENERFDFEGKYWQVEGGLLAPPPYQPGGWPIWGGGNAVPAAIRRSADYADAWTCDPLPLAMETWETQVGLYKGRAAKLGKKPFVVLMRDGWVADTFEEAAADFGERFAREVRFYFRQGLLTHHPDFRSESDITARSIASHMVLGTPRQCIEQLERFHEEYGVDYVVLCSRLTGGPPLERSIEHVRRFGEEVVAPVHAKYAAPDHPAIPAACRW